MRTRTRVRKYKKPLKATPTPRVMLGVGALLAALFVWVAYTDEPAQPARVPDGFAAAAAPARTGDAAAPARAQSPVYRYSVIAGGVHDRAALAGAVRRDPVVAAHYARFDVARARIVKLDAPRWVHVSYRVRDKVYWTSKKVMLAAGESVITDGKTSARTRCGNQLSAVPMAPVMVADEPQPEVLDTMMVSAEGISDAAAEVPVGQGAAPQALDTPPAQAASVSGPAARPSPGMSLLSAPPVIEGWRTQSTPPTVLHGVVVTGPTPTPTPWEPPPPTNPPAPKDPLPPVNPPTPQDPPAPQPQPQPTPQNPLPPDSPRPPPNQPAPFVPPRAPTPVPEPGTISLVAGALAVMAVLRRKKRDQVRRT